ncbi:hypothetical protein SAMN04488024_106220 [Pedobacter soli]|uniref:Uncharacterized protein n=1 Tax=Pedobacter soli TaxID=390242 RepID=A0A1G6VQM3_9SPHI|nr:hypothetical protein SAMN04488024_106220 [Pedobacter soli]
MKIVLKWQKKSEVGSQESEDIAQSVNLKYQELILVVAVYR